MSGQRFRADTVWWAALFSANNTDISVPVPVPVCYVSVVEGEEEGEEEEEHGGGGGEGEKGADKKKKKKGKKEREGERGGDSGRGSGSVLERLTLKAMKEVKRMKRDKAEVYLPMAPKNLLEASEDIYHLIPSPSISTSISTSKKEVEAEKEGEKGGAGVGVGVGVGALTRPREFNLMFQTTIGSSASTERGGERGGAEGYLRPETAQGIFANFPNILRTSRMKVCSMVWCVCGVCVCDYVDVIEGAYEWIRKCACVCVYLCIRTCECAYVCWCFVAMWHCIFLCCSIV